MNATNFTTALFLIVSRVRGNDIGGVATATLKIQHYIFCVKTEVRLIDDRA